MKSEDVVKITSGLVAFLAVSLAGCGSTPASRVEEQRPVPVSLGRVDAVDLPVPFEAGGIVRARATAAIASRVMAPVARVHVRPGDRVRRGAPLVTLDAREIDANSARAAAASAAAVESARAAESDTRAADAALRLARATHERMKALHETRSATTQELDQAIAGLSAAEAQLASARARAEAATAARDAAKASMEAARIAASYAVLSAPFNGVIAERSVDPGSMAVPGTPLLILEDTTAYRLEVQLDEARAAAVRVGGAVDVRLGADAGWTAAPIVEIARVDPGSHSFLVKIDIAGAPGLRSGGFGRARFAGAPRRTLVVPASAVFRRGQLTFVYVAGSDGAARLRSISPGATTAERVEVLAGLRDNEIIVLNPPPSLADGVRVAGGAPARSSAQRAGDRP